MRNMFDNKGVIVASGQRYAGGSGVLTVATASFFLVEVCKVVGVLVEMDFSGGTEVDEPPSVLELDLCTDVEGAFAGLGV